MTTKNHAIASRAEWLEARKQLLAKEKELTRLRERLGEERRSLPWVRVEKTYAFERSRGRATLADLFDGKSQLAVYHFMFAPEWENGCKSCSFWADSFDHIGAHLAARDVAFVAASRAPLAKLSAFAKRLGWSFEWVSSQGSDFNYDYAVSFSEETLATGSIPYNYGTHPVHTSEMPGVSVFCKDAGGTVFHTYSTYGRGIDPLNTAYSFLDLVPKGRDEAGLPHPMAWVRLRDSYGQ
jgi:predicted dithiol-disulfide oxidoreductase (DUF899 family)